MVINNELLKELIHLVTYESDQHILVTLFNITDAVLTQSNLADSRKTICQEFSKSQFSGGCRLFLAVLMAFIRVSSQLKPTTQNSILYNLIIEVIVFITKMPDIVQSNQSLIIEVFETLHLILEDNVKFSFIARLLDSWEKGKIDREHMHRSLKLIYQQGKPDQKTSAIKMLSKELQQPGLGRLNSCIELIINQILDVKSWKLYKNISEFLFQALNFLTMILKIDSMLLVPVLSEDFMSSLYSYISEIAGLEPSSKVIEQYFSFLSHAFQFDEVK